jgi:hypothetical protein
MYRPDKRIGWATLAGLGLAVAAFMALSLVVTATGTSRYAVAMGYDARVGCAVGVVFDLGKGLLPIGLLALWSQRAWGRAGPLSAAWICLVIYSCLATHATVSMASSSIERTGTWKMEVRSNAKAELAMVEQQLATLSRPSPPRPAKTVGEALAATSVPPAIWKDSNECGSIRESVYFAKACAHVAQLRRELAASQDYERLSTLAAELRKRLAETQIVATSDPLAAAFGATLGRVLPIGGKEGVALLLTTVVEIMSCMGLAGWAALRHERSQPPVKGSLGPPSPGMLKGSLPEIGETLPHAQMPTLPKPSLCPGALEKGRERHAGEREGSNPPSNVLPMRPRAPSNATSLKAQGGSVATPATEPSHVPDFVRQRLQDATGVSLTSKELRAAYDAWCAAHGLAPLSMPKFAGELRRLGYEKWKSSGLMRYRNLKLVA